MGVECLSVLQAVKQENWYIALPGRTLSQMTDCGPGSKGLLRILIDQLSEQSRVVGKVGGASQNRDIFRGRWGLA